MELKTLLIGLVMSTAAFALKSGTGLSYAFMHTRGVVRRGMILTSFVFGYGLVFGLAAIILVRGDLMARVDLMQNFFKSGMTLHFIFAGLLLFWGGVLLKQDPGKQRTSRAWVALLVPCPVCFGVILLSCGFVLALYPKQLLVFPLLYTGFILISISVALTGSFLAKTNGFTGHQLGMIMVVIAVYFLLSVIVVPQFADLDKVYRISTPETVFTYTPIKAGLLLFSTLALIIGFLNPLNRKN